MGFSNNFIPGRELSRRFYWEAVRPLLDQHFPNLPHAAAMLGSGSEVLGFDTPMSRDHDWVPGMMLFLPEPEAHLQQPIQAMLAHHLPFQFLGHPVHAEKVAAESGTVVMKLKTERPLNHRVVPVTLRAFALQRLDLDLDQPLQAADWLSFSAQILLSLTSGAVHYDGVGELTEFRQRLAWYPRDVWLYLLASGWQRISEEEHLMPRAGYVGDELGSAVIAARLVRDVMSLCFLMEKQYAPYPKWFGSAFRRLRCAGAMAPPLWQTVQASTWQERESALGQAYELLAGMHNALGITAPLPEKTGPFFDRPFQVIGGESFAEAICQQISDPEVRQIAGHGLIGGVDQFSDHTYLRSWVSWRGKVRKLYEE